MSGDNPHKKTDIAGVIEKRRDRASAREETGALIRRVLVIALVLWLVFAHVFLITQVDGQHMFPAMHDGDLALVYRLQQGYMREDIVAYNVNGERHFGRIVAQSGDEVIIDGSGNLRINGQMLSEEIMFPTYTRDGEVMQYFVPSGHVYVLGDYRTNTVDSRDFGPVSKADIEGKLITLLRRRGL